MIVVFDLNYFTVIHFLKKEVIHMKLSSTIYHSFFNKRRKDNEIGRNLFAYPFL